MCPSYAMHTTIDSYIVLTFMNSCPTNKDDTFMGQAIVRVRDYAAQIYRGVGIDFTDYPLIGYVAPVENTWGIAEVVLFVALQEKQVTGTYKSIRFIGTCFKGQIRQTGRLYGSSIRLHVLL